MASIENIYGNILKFLNCNDTGSTLGSIFSPENTLEYMFQTLWSFPESRIFLRVPNPKASMHRKGQRESNLFRQEGNRLYKEGKLGKALAAYNYSILSAPFSTHDNSDKKDKEDQNPTECLSLGYANRSAVLFEMNQCNEAILDIDRAIKYGYEKVKISKLYERRAKCLMKRGLFEQASDVLRSIPTSKANKTASNHVDRLLTACKCKDNNYLKSTNDWNFSEIFYTGPPNLSEPRHATKISNNGKQSHLSNAIKVQYTSSKGRHLVAKRNILPGELLLSEEAQCSMVKLDVKQRSYCCNCLRRAPIILPCPTCSLVVFCCEECQKVATSSEGFHRKECHLLPSLICMKPDVNVALAFRVMCSFSLSEIKQQADKSTARRYQSFSNSEFVDLGYNYETLYNLEGNLKFRKRESLIEAAVNAVLLVKLLLKNISFFGKNLDSMGVDTYAMNNKDVIYLVGGHIMRIILNMQCNSHCIKELNYSPKATDESNKMDTVGHSVFCILTLVNHSCVPNVFTSNLGNRKIMFAISCISAGEEICDSYGERYVSHDKNIRQAALQDTYFFQCRCIACQQDWPIFPYLQDNLVFICQKCHRESEFEQCPKCTNGNRKNKRKNKKRKDMSTDTLHSKETIVMVKEYNNTRYNLNNVIDFEDYNQKISNFINYLQNHTVIPNKQLIEAQENLLKLFDLYGSQIIVAAKN